MRWLEKHWYRNGPADRLLGSLLWPASLLFGALAALRRMAYRCGLQATTRLPVPVVVVGNISVGGTGKTPLTITLSAQLRDRHRHPGIVTRGYGGSTGAPRAVAPDSDPRASGDEAVLLARRSGCPVWAGADRVAAGRALLAAHPQCDVLISDDGLQHYALARDFEIVVIDAARGFGNGLLLPAGPLRETPARLARVHALVMNGDGPAVPPGGATVYRMNLTGESFRNLQAPQQQVHASHFSGQTVHAVAAIGNPQRFFDHLRALGIACCPHPFPDHHAFTAADLAFGDGAPVLMTEKDAVKCEAFADSRQWVLQVDAHIDGDLAGQITRQLGTPG